MQVVLGCSKQKASHPSTVAGFFRAGRTEAILSALFFCLTFTGPVRRISQSPQSTPGAIPAPISPGNGWGVRQGRLVPDASSPDGHFLPRPALFPDRRQPSVASCCFFVRRSLGALPVRRAPRKLYPVLRPFPPALHLRRPRLARLPEPPGLRAAHGRPPRLRTAGVLAIICPFAAGHMAAASASQGDTHRESGVLRGRKEDRRGSVRTSGAGARTGSGSRSPGAACAEPTCTSSRATWTSACARRW